MSKYRDAYYPGTEELAPDEMRVIAVGTGMPNLRPSQMSASWFVELGNGDKFFFDMGTGFISRFCVLGVPYDEANKLFLSHLHSDHCGNTCLERADAHIRLAGSRPADVARC